MALTVVTAPFDPLCNSYVSVAAVTAYVTDRVVNPLVAPLWAALTADQKSTYVVNATRSVDSGVEWIGDRYSRDQVFHWPRVNAYVDGYLVDQVTFPKPVVEATCEMVVWLLTNAGEQSVQNQEALDSVKVGPINIRFNPSAGSAYQYYPDTVAYLLRDYGSLTDPNQPGNRSIKVARLTRA